MSGLTRINGTGVSRGSSLYSWNPRVAVPYVGLLSVAAVVGTIGNVVVILIMIVKHVRSSQRTEAAGDSVGRALIVNLATSDLIVTAVINPLAIAGRILFR